MEDTIKGSSGELYFINSRGVARLLGSYETEAEASRAIGIFCDQRNYHIHYIRKTPYDDYIWYDVGSWSEFFQWYK